MKNHLIRFLALTLAMALALCGCGSKAAPERTLPDTSEDASMSTDVSLPEEEEPDFTPQYTCIADHSSVWFSEEEDSVSPALYAVTDLDGNGLLEVIRSTCEGSGMYSTSAFFEVNEAMDGMIELDYGVEEGDSEPDIITSFVNNYSDGNSCYYIVDDIIRNGAAENITVHYALCKKGTSVQIEKLGSRHMDYKENQGEVETFYDAEGSEIDAETYFDIDVTRFEDFTYDVCYLDWQILYPEDNFALFAQLSHEAYASGAALERDPYQVDIYANPESDLYWKTGVDRIWLPGVENPETRIRFVCAPDGVQVALEQVEWIESANLFQPVGEVFCENTIAGTVYEFPATLAETVPSYRLRIQDDYGTNYWYLTMDGSGERPDPIEIYYADQEFELPAEDDSFMTLCKAYAGMMITAGEQAALEQNYYWRTVGNAAMLQTLKSADADEDGRIYLSEWLMNAYCDAMFPYVWPQPEMTENCPVNYYEEWNEDPYKIHDALFYDDSSTRVVSIDRTETEVMQAHIAVSTQMGEEGVTINFLPNPNTPFGYQITDAVISAG